jgi:hypothetical protein
VQGIASEPAEATLVSMSSHQNVGGRQQGEITVLDLVVKSIVLAHSCFPSLGVLAAPIIPLSLLPAFTFHFDFFFQCEFYIIVGQAELRLMFHNFCF